jgi:DNA-binding NtrC family response regulator
MLLSLLSRQRFDVIFLDMNYKSTLGSGNEGLFWLGRIREKDPTATVIMITAHGEISTAVRSLKAGATDFLVKPWRNDQLLETLEAALQHRANPEKSPPASAARRRLRPTSCCSEKTGRAKSWSPKPCTNGHFGPPSHLSRPIWRP